MLKPFLTAAIAAFSLFAGSTAVASQVVAISEPNFLPDGVADPYGVFTPPGAGMQAFVSIFYSGGEMIAPGTEIYTTREVTYTYYDESYPGGVNGNEYYFDQVCSLSNGCIRIVRPGLAVAKLTTPRDQEFRECTAVTIGDCSLRYNEGISYLGARFVSDGTSDVINISVQVSDFTAVPDPATWALLIAGFGMTGAGLRRRRSVDAEPPQLAAPTERDHQL